MNTDGPGRLLDHSFRLSPDPSVDPRPVGTEEFVFSLSNPRHPSTPCSGGLCGGKALRRNCRRSFLLNGRRSTAAHLRSELAPGVRQTVSQRRVLHGLSLDHVGIIPRCRILRRLRPQWLTRLSPSPRVWIRDSSLPTPILPKARTNYQYCRLLELEGG